MRILFFFLLLAGFLCFVVASFSQRPTKVNLVALGLAFWILPTLITAGEAAFVG